MNHQHPKRLKLTVLRNLADALLFKVNKRTQYCIYSYDKNTQTLAIRKHNNKNLYSYIDKYKKQLLKIIKSIPAKKQHSGLKLRIVLGIQTPQFNTKNEDLLVLKKQGKIHSLRKTSWHQPDCAIAYTDGSYDDTKKCGGYGILIQRKGEEKIISHSTALSGNNLIELFAVIKALKYLKKEKQIRLVTDSQYVIKGLVYWIEVWRLNHWYTASGQKAQHKKYWKKLDKLSRNKTIEINWIKGHNHHREHTLCDKLAKNHLSKI